MQKFILSAVFALCLAIPGMANANVCPTNSFVEFVKGELSDYEVLKKAACQLKVDSRCLIACYEAGEVMVEKITTGYLVHWAKSGGGLIIAIEDNV